MDLEEVWRIREEDLYPSMFGPISRGIFPLDHSLFANRFRQEKIDPRWLTMGVFEFAPYKERNHWLYVTSGYSNPWEDDPETYDPESESGSGVEFVFAVSEPGDWAIETLQSMLAFDVLLAAGRFSDSPPLSLGDRIPLRAPINGDPACEIRNLVVVVHENGPKTFQLPSGEVTLVGFTGIADAELQFAKANTSETLIETLRTAGHHPVTDPNRSSIY